MHRSRNVRQRTFGHVCPVKIQIRLRIRAVWSESSLGAFLRAKETVSTHADKEDSDQTAQADSSLCGGHMSEDIFLRRGLSA